jgi:hypothetical protein
MVKKFANRGPQPPEWWKLDLYGYLKDLTLEGWIWEFRRRAELKAILGKIPVDAMNPNPDRQISSPGFYRRGCDVELKYQTYLYANSAVRKGVFRRSRHFPPEFTMTAPVPTIQSDQLVFTRRPRNYVNLHIDLNFRDTFLIEDFERLLAQLRLKHPQPPMHRFKRKNWVRNRILETWDLRQFKVSWSSISDIFEQDDTQSARNAFKEAKTFIHEARWVDLARQVESNRIREQTRNRKAKKSNFRGSD